MSRKKKFNVIYNGKEEIGFGCGYYVVFEGHDYKPCLDSVYHTWEHNESVDGVSCGLINKIIYLCDLGYVFDHWYCPDLKEMF